MIKLPKVRNPFAPERGTERINYFRFGRTLFDGFAMVIVDEQITLESEVTQYAVETGSHISDHIKPLPVRIVYNGMVSNDHNRQGATQAWHRLTAAYKDREPVTVFGSVDIFDNMALESIQLQREGASVRGLAIAGADQRGRAGERGDTRGHFIEAPSKAEDSGDETEPGSRAAGGDSAGSSV